MIRHTDSLFAKQALQGTEQAKKSAKRGFLFYVRKVEKDFDYVLNLFELTQGLKKTRSNVGAPSVLINENYLSEFAILRAQNSDLRAIVETQDLEIKELEKVIRSGFDDLERKFNEKMGTILTTVMEDSLGPAVSDLQVSFNVRSSIYSRLSISPRGLPLRS